MQTYIHNYKKLQIHKYTNTHTQTGGKVAERRYRPGLTGNSANTNTQMHIYTITQKHIYTKTQTQIGGKVAVQIPPWINQK